jgi:hypothetical protein
MDLQFFTGDIEIDGEIMVEKLKEAHLQTGTDRKKHYKQYWGKYPTSDMISATWGYTKRGKMSEDKWRVESDLYGYYQTQVMTNNEQLDDVFHEYAMLHLPKTFHWNQVQINKNWAIPPHRDASNQGRSYIVGLGDYKNGRLMVNINGKNKSVNIRNKVFGFDGSKHTHWVTPFVGERWSLVFFTHHGKNELRQLRKKKKIEDEKN